MDVVASLYGRNNILSLIEATANEIFIPLTVGGGIRSIDDIRSVLRAGQIKCRSYCGDWKSRNHSRSITKIWFINHRGFNRGHSSAQWNLRGVYR